MELTKKQLIELVQFATGKIHSSFTWEDVAEDAVDEYLNAINYTHCCKSDSEQLQAVEDLKEFARNNCREWNVEEMEEIIDRL